MKEARKERSLWKDTNLGKVTEALFDEVVTFSLRVAGEAKKDESW